MKIFLQVFLVFFVVVLFLSSVTSARFFKIPEWLVKNWRFHAITLPPFGIFLAASAQNQSTIDHELVHWKQWQRMGTIGFYITYIWGWLKYGYRNNPMEIEAYGT